MVSNEGVVVGATAATSESSVTSADTGMAGRSSSAATNEDDLGAVTVSISGDSDAEDCAAGSSVIVVGMGGTIGSLAAARARESRRAGLPAGLGGADPGALRHRGGAGGRFAGRCRPANLLNPLVYQKALFVLYHAKVLARFDAGKSYIL